MLNGHYELIEKYKIFELNHLQLLEGATLQEKSGFTSFDSEGDAKYHVLNETMPEMDGVAFTILPILEKTFIEDKGE